MITRMSARARARGKRDQGAMAVEFAIVVPIMVLLVVGLLEFSLVMRDWLGVASAVRLGVRVAAAEPDAGEAICPGPPVICAPNTTPALAQSAADAIQRSGTSMSKDLIDFIWVYQANQWGWPTNAAATSTSSNPTVGAQTQAAALSAGCTTSCVRFRWNPTIDKFVYDGGTWNSRYVVSCTNDSKLQSVGVFMSATHPFLTNMIRSTMTLTDKAVMSFEPRPNPECEWDKHA